MSQTKKTVEVVLPPKMVPVFNSPRGAVRYRCAYGGRGSGKSYSFALMAAAFGRAEPLRILGTREFQASIKESFYAEVQRVIEDTPWLDDFYDIGKSYIRGANGTEFIFRGLRHNISAIQSMADIDLAIVEEAEGVPETSWQKLTPTIRAPRSEIWAIWNPQDRDSPVDKRFLQNTPENAVIRKLNYHDNPWMPKVLEEERRHDQEILDPATYAHIWEGAYLENSDAQILHGKVRVAEFEPGKDWNGPYYGMDFGFAQDPTTCNECWIDGDILYVSRESGEVGMELDDTSGKVKEDIPGIEKYTIRADNARPESISYLKRHGLPRIKACEKWSGSVEDGIEHLRSYKEIVIHPRCQETTKETRLYSYKVDSKSGDILPKIVDAHNHHIDAIRYALGPIIKGSEKSHKDRNALSILSGAKIYD